MTLPALTETEQTDAEIRREFVRAKMIQKWKQRDIVVAIQKSRTIKTVSQQVVSNDMAMLRQEMVSILRGEAEQFRAEGLATLEELEGHAWAQFKKHKTPEWWEKLLSLQARKSKLLGLDHEREGPVGGRGETPDRPLYVAQVGYDINSMLGDPVVAGLVKQLDARLKELSGTGEGLVLEGEYEVKA